MSYLRITVTKAAGAQQTYKALDPKVVYTEDALDAVARLVANGDGPWLWEVVDDTGAVSDSGSGV